MQLMNTRHWHVSSYKMPPHPWGCKLLLSLHLTAGQPGFDVGVLGRQLVVAYIR